SISTVDASSSVPNHDIEVFFDLSNHRIMGSVNVSIPAKVKAIVVPAHLKVTRFLLNDKPLSAKVKDGYVPLPPHPDGTHLYISYEGIFGKGDDRMSNGIISHEGVYLTRHWYPAADANLSHFSLRAHVPEGFHAVSEADRVSVEKAGMGTLVTFDFPHPVSHISLVMAPYNVERDHHKDVELTTYFLAADHGRAARYLAYTKKYLRMYEELLGPYPYQRFSIVEGLLPTGQSMPTFTLLGRQVLKLPFIPETSLGHEILHSWFGNSVYVDHKTGNWCEGLTSYLSDHYYEAMKGKGWEYRKKILEDYESYVFEKNEIAVRDFQFGEDRPLRAIGYGKVAMIFHALKNRIGDEAFMNGLKILIRERLFKSSSWRDLQMSFSETAGEDLDAFFRFWLEQKGAIKLRVDQIRSRNVGQGYGLEFRIDVTNGPLPLRVPVFIRTDTNMTKRIFTVTKGEQVFTVLVDTMPREIILDPDYDLFRGLTFGEKTPGLSRLLGDPTRTVILPDDHEETYKTLVQHLIDRGFTVVKEKSINHSTLGQTSLLFLGPQTGHGSFFPMTKEPLQGFSLRIKFNLLDPNRVVGLIIAKNKEEVTSVGQKVFHYGNYSHLTFLNGTNVEKATRESSRGSSLRVSPPMFGVSLKSIQSLPEIVSIVANKALVYVGEKHDRYADHLVQLEIIRGLHQHHPKLAIAMEMFQRPYQKALDDYVSGKTEEKTFLKESRYFGTWMFNYHLYRDILLYARDRRIPVIALNLDHEIVRKVSQKGLASLTEEERQLIPEDMDFSDENYRQRLESVFETHREQFSDEDGPHNFENFYQAQVVWDEAMAENIRRFLADNPDYHLVVLAGNGHLSYGSGIPRRAHRRTGRDYATILPDPQVPLEPALADFVVFPGDVDVPQPPKLMVSVDGKEGPLKVASFLPGSGAKEAGMKKGDIILAVDEERVEDLATLRVILFTRKDGDTVRVRIQRGDEELELSVQVKVPSQK
ncbi:MAG: ChaN family lipoprotein, partial [Pseudomonadota bacterium]